MKKIVIAGIVLAIIIIGVLLFRPETEKNVQKTADFPPPAPTGLLASPGILLVNLSWDPVPSANTYNIYWSTESPVTMSDQNRIASVTTRYVHTGLAGDTVHTLDKRIQRGLNGKADTSKNGRSQCDSEKYCQGPAGMITQIPQTEPGVYAKEKYNISHY